jgi:hypothetical protein
MHCLTPQQASLSVALVWDVEWRPPQSLSPPKRPIPNRVRSAKRPEQSEQGPGDHPNDNTGHCVNECVCLAPGPAVSANTRNERQTRRHPESPTRGAC